MGVLNPRTGSHPVHTVHRVGAALLGAFLIVFAMVGMSQGVPLLSTEGAPVMGLYANGLLAGISLLVGLVLVASAARGGPTASMVSVVVGVLFLLSGLGNVIVVGTPMNMLAFQLPNIIFSLGVGVVLLVLGAYGRFTVNLPSENPYHRDTAKSAPAWTVEQHNERAHSRAAITELADAERADALHRATHDQHRRLAEVNRHRTQDERRQAWVASAPS